MFWHDAWPFGSFYLSKYATFMKSAIKLVMWTFRYSVCLSCTMCTYPRLSKEFDESVQINVNLWAAGLRKSKAHLVDTQLQVTVVFVQRSCAAWSRVRGRDRLQHMHTHQWFDSSVNRHLISLSRCCNSSQFRGLISGDWQPQVEDRHSLTNSLSFDLSLIAPPFFCTLFLDILERSSCSLDTNLRHVSN